MISRLFPTKQLLWTSEKASNMSGNFGVQQHGHPGELRPALAQIPRGRRSVDAPRPRVLPRASNREPRLGVDDGDGDARRVLRVREGLGASEAAEAGADDDDVFGHRVIRERKNVR